MHKVEIPAAILERIAASRGTRHIFADLDPMKTAHLIVDLQNGALHVCRSPERGQYRDQRTTQAPGAMPVAGLPGVSVDLSGILPG